MKKYSRILIIVNLILLLGYFNWSVYQKEQTLKDGQLVLLQLAPVDPRSLMQGDYMRLSYKEASSDLLDQQTAIRGYAILQIDSNQVGKIVRLQEHPLGWIVDAYAVEHLHGQFLRIFPAHLAVFQHGFRDLLPDGDRGVQRGHGVLKHHGDLLAADFAHLLIADFGQVGAFKFNFAVFNAGSIGQQAQDGHGSNAFAAAGLTSDAKDLALMHFKADAAHSLHFAGGSHKGGFQILYLQNRLAHFALLTSSASGPVHHANHHRQS